MKASDFVKFLEEKGLMDSKIDLVDFRKGKMIFYPFAFDPKMPSEYCGMIKEFTLRPVKSEWYESPLSGPIV